MTLEYSLNILMQIIGIGTIVFYAGKLTNLTESLKKITEDHEKRVRKLERHTYICGAQRKATH